MLQAFFLSDLHLTSMQDPRSGVLLHFLATLKGGENCSHLFLVGDIFDLWLADHGYFQKAYAPLIDEVRRLVSEGVEVHYFEGNHDLYLTRFWSGVMGVRVHEGPATFQLGPFAVRVEHGDQADPEDRGYLFLRWFLRTPVLRWLAQHLPEWLVVQIGERASRKSRQYTSTVKAVSESAAREKLHRYAQQLAAKEKFDLLINGHVHVQDDFNFSAAGHPVRAINLGSWLFGQYQALKVDDQGPRFIAAE